MQCASETMYTNLQFKYSKIDAELKKLSERMIADEMSTTQKTTTPAPIKTPTTPKTTTTKPASKYNTSKFYLFYAVLNIKTIFYFSHSVPLSK